MLLGSIRKDARLLLGIVNWHQVSQNTDVWKHMLKDARVQQRTVIPLEEKKEKKNEYYTTYQIAYAIRCQELC